MEGNWLDWSTFLNNWYCKGNLEYNQLGNKSAQEKLEIQTCASLTDEEDHVI